MGNSVCWKKRGKIDKLPKKSWTKTGKIRMLDTFATPNGNKAPKWIADNAGSADNEGTIQLLKLKHSDIGSPPLFQCNIEDSSICDFSLYKNKPIWTAYGDPSKSGGSGLQFRLVTVKTGKVPCKADKGRNCFIVVPDEDIEPHFGTWRLAGTCQNCQNVAFSVSIGESTSGNTGVALAVLTPVVSVSGSRSMSTSKSQGHKFSYKCPKDLPFAYQRELHYYSWLDKSAFIGATVSNVGGSITKSYQFIENTLSMGLCGGNIQVPPKCGGQGKCVDNACQDCRDTPAHDPPFASI